MPIKLLVLDIDGTIAGKSNQVSQPVKDAIAAVQEQGIEVAIATGRMYRSACRFHQDIASKMPLTAYNGAWVQHPLTEEMYQHQPVPTPIVEQLLTYLEQKDWKSQIEVHCYVADQVYVRQITDHTRIYEQRSGVSAIAVDDWRCLFDSPLTKILAIGQEIPVIEHLSRELAQIYTPEDVFFTQSYPQYLEFIHPQANKGEAIRYLAEQVLDLESDEIMAIGDGLNDFQMLEYAGVSVAMGNAPETLKGIADWVAPDVEADGVASALQEFFSI